MAGIAHRFDAKLVMKIEQLQIINQQLSPLHHQSSGKL
jgi:hypothetical protein